ncbi:MAG: Veg protein [Tissierellia bacterium]|nr:Veg protein [Tissierellia bacterium]
MAASSVVRVKGIVEDCVGKKVRFKVRRGKSRSHFVEGTILNTYPSIFTVFVENKDFQRIVSFNYIDIITNYVEFFICDEQETRIV